MLRTSGDDANFITAQSSNPALGRHPSSNANGPRSVTDFHTMEIESLAVVTQDLTVASTIVKGVNETSNLDQLAIVP
ncbi:MAG: hypothetical protein ABSE75_02625 [Acidimicrobiales bacterium]|jgi:hypothetical protein